jgi:hypothetical protein
VEYRTTRRRQHPRPWPSAGMGDEAPLSVPGGATWRYALTTGWRSSARAHLREEEREQGSEPGRPMTPTTPPPRPRRPRPLPPLGLGGGAPRRELGGEAEDGDGATTRAREVVDVVEVGVWRPRVSSSRVRASQTSRKVGGGC